MENFVINMTIKGSSVARVYIGNSQNQGMRPYQEDSFGFTELSDAAVAGMGFMAIVADGMGGLNDSKQISSYAVDFMKENFGRYDGTMSVSVWLEEVLQAMNTSASDMDTGGGSTFAAVLCRRDGVYWCNVGDSRIYLVRNGRFCQITEDEDYFTNLLDEVLKNEMYYEDAEDNVQKSALTQYIGSGRWLAAEVSQRALVPESGDVILICSDGVYNALADEEIADILQKKLPQAAAYEIESAVLDKGYANQDNFTSVVLKFE